MYVLPNIHKYITDNKWITKIYCKKYKVSTNIETWCQLWYWSGLQNTLHGKVHLVGIRITSTREVDQFLKLVCNLLNYRVLGTSTATVFFQMIILSMHLYTSDGRHVWFHFHGTSRPVRSASKAKKYKMKNSCPQWDSNWEPEISSLCSTDWVSRACWMLSI